MFLKLTIRMVRNMNKKDLKFIKKCKLFDSNETLKNSVLAMYNGLATFGNNDDQTIAITSIENNTYSVSMAIALYHLFVEKGESALLLNLDMNNEILKEEVFESLNTIFVDVCDNVNELLDGKSKALSIKSDKFVADVLKSKELNDFIDKAKTKYRRIVFIVSNMNETKDIFLLKDIIDTSTIVVKRNSTLLKSIFDNVEFIKENHIPFSGITYIK